MRAYLAASCLALALLPVASPADNDGQIAAQCPDGCAILTPKTLAALAAEFSSMQAEINRLKALRPVNCS